ncbi:substrate-binding domain-containing protein (plasmid) [Shinella yambaruensis]|uniref:LacI family DNA-binding transcriptional regulator n=1 Tax=Shinella yambaruensis TaxID=415996 RepID=UPI003D79287D
MELDGRKKRRTRAPSKAPARLSDVAALAGVSAGTVSRVFSAPHLVAPETARAVREAIDKLGWVANGGARTLASHRSRTIGAVIPNLENPVFAQMMQAIQDKLLSERYTLLLNCSDYDPEKALLGTRSMLERGVDGLILLGENFSDALWHLLEVQRVPKLIIYSFRSSGARQFVGIDNVRAARKAAEHLLDLGHREFVILGQRADNNDRVAARLYGFTEALRDRGIPAEARRVIETPWSIQAGYDAISELVRTGTMPTALLCTNDYHAVGAVSACQRHGLRVPDDLSIVGFDDLEIAAHTVPPLTTVKVPARAIGESAAQRIVDHLEKNEPLASVEFEVTLVVRGSTAAVNV